MAGFPERPSINERTALAAEVSLDFECSFAAAEANKAAYALIDAREKEKERLHSINVYIEKADLQIVGEEFDIRNYEVIEREWHGVSAEQPFSLALIQPIQSSSQKILSRFLRRQIDTEVVETRQEPILVAKFEDVALPLATFARRKDGQCSYVQIGSEIKDDNFHVLATDDSTGRNVVIEAIRGLLSPKYNADPDQPGRTVTPHTSSEKQKEALLKLIAIETAQNKEKLAAAFEAQLVRKSFAELGPNSWRRLIVVNEAGEDYEGRYALRTLIEETQLPDNRIAQLVIAKPVDGPNQDLGHIMALTRGQIALPVATLNASTGQITFENSELEARTERRQEVVYTFLSILRGNPLVQHGRTPSSESNNGLKKSITNQRSRIRKKIENMPVFDSEPIESVVDWIRAAGALGRDTVLNAEHRAKLNVLNEFKVQSRLANTLGATSNQEETLVQHIFNMTLDSNVHRGVIKNVNLGSTIADIDFEVEIEYQGSIYQVTVSRKPAAMEDEALKRSPAFCFSYDITKPIGAQLNGTMDHIQEIISYFKQLKPVKEQATPK